jgi:hypothetical protein
MNRCIVGKMPLILSLIIILIGFANIVIAAEI